MRIKPITMSRIRATNPIANQAFVRRQRPLRTLAGRAGFTLLELIGVMLVIAILAAAVAPVAVQLIQYQRQVSEEAFLPVIGDALKRAILREQHFPMSSSSASAAAVPAEVWWKMAARHGAGGEFEIRYSRPSSASDNSERRVYLAQPDWGGKSFFEVTANGGSGVGRDWLDNPRDPIELRLLIFSTMNLDLPLPASLTSGEFNKFWDEWSVGLNGGPGVGELADYGLSAAWAGRAAELNIERIDLRELLCQVVIENRLHASAFYDADGDLRRSIPLTTPQIFLADPLPVLGTHNLQGARLQLEMDFTAGDPVAAPPVEDQVSVTGILILQSGRRIDEESAAEIRLAGRLTNGETVFIQQPLDDSSDERAPIDLLDPNAANGIGMDGWAVADDSVQERYFLRSQELLLGLPANGEVAGVFVIDKSFQTLRFDGLKWGY